VSSKPPRVKEYVLQVRVKDDGIGDPHDDAVTYEYLNKPDIIEEIEKVVTEGLTVTVEKWDGAPAKPDDPWAMLLEARDLLSQVGEAVARTNGLGGCGCIKDLPGDNYTCTAHQNLWKWSREQTLTLLSSRIALKLLERNAHEGRTEAPDTRGNAGGS
jgi:hypothetical protein